MSLFLKQAKFKNGKTYLSIVDGFRDGNKVKQKVIQKLGYLDDLQKQFNNPIEHFKKIVEDMKKESAIHPPSSLDENEPLKNDDNFLNIGYIFVKLIYNQLNLKDLFKSKQKNLNVSYDLYKIFTLLVLSRILYPGSKKETFENRKIFFEPFNCFELEDIYRSLDYFCSYKEEIETLLWNNTKEDYKRDTTETYFDCTNYYFEINYNDTDLCNEKGEIIEAGYRKRGPEKNHRPDPIIELGLLMDSNDIPLAYDIFPGNESEKLHLLPTIRRVKGKFKLNRTIVVADRGLNTSDNIYYLAGKNENSNMDGYIYGQSVRGADQEFKKWVLEPDGYISEPIFKEDGTPEIFRQMKFDEEGKFIGYEKKQSFFKHKSRIYPKELTLTKDGKRNTKVRTDQKQMVYYSQKYADKQRRDRNQMVERAKDLIKNPKKYNRVTASGAASYIENIKFDKETGEVKEGLDLSLKEKKIKEEEKYDGYYSIVTSELNMSDKELRRKYRGLSKIEDTFKVTKTDLETRPVYVWTKEHIEAHFLTCFVALVVIRLLEQKTNNKIPVSQLINSMKKFGCVQEFSNIYMFMNKDNIIDTLSQSFNIEFSKKRLSRKKIKDLLKY